MPRNKPIPRSQRLEFNRGTKVSRNSPAVKDDVKNVSVGLMDMDSSILYYFNEVIKPEVDVNKEKVKVGTDIVTKKVIDYNIPLNNLGEFCYNNLIQALGKSFPIDKIEKVLLDKIMRPKIL